MNADGFGADEDGFGEHADSFGAEGGAFGANADASGANAVGVGPEDLFMETGLHYSEKQHVMCNFRQNS